jgi:membrane protease YdiL (CAAX protease family)
MSATMVATTAALVSAARPEARREVWRRIRLFLALTAALSSVCWLLMLRTGQSGPLAMTVLLWSPGIAGLITRYYYERSLDQHGWAWGTTRLQVLSYLIPIAYVVPVYLVVWMTGLGGFYDEAFLARQMASFGWSDLPGTVALPVYFARAGTVGMIRTCTTALGEELGWRGLLVPELAKVTSFTKVAFVSGAAWAIWHYPTFLIVGSNSGAPTLYGLACFTVMIVGLAFLYAWMRLASGNVWTAMLLHASHNMFVLGVFDPLTTDTGRTELVTGELGIGLALSGAVVGGLAWRRRGRLPVRLVQ